MEELEIIIDESKQRKIDLELKVLKFTNYGRSPSDEDFEKMIEYLDEWDKIRYKTDVLEECLNAYKQNKK